MPVLAALVPAALGIYQGISGAAKASKAQHELENQKSPTLAPNKGIMDYYQMAMNKYNQNPYTSAFYQNQKNVVGNQLATGLNAATSRRAGVANIGALTQGADNSLLKAGAQAEQLKNQAFGQVGQATNMQAQDQQRQFQYNQLLPYQAQRQLLGLKASGAVQEENAGIANIGNAANTYGELDYLKKSGYGGGYQSGNYQGGGGAGGMYQMLSQAARADNY